MTYIFGAPPSRVKVVPNGVEEAFLNSQPATRGPWLVCTATITPRKRVLELAQAALHAQTPVWIIGKPYSDTDPYCRAFLDLAQQNPKVIRYEGAINDRARLAKIYREARGFVLLSSMESLSLSALEATACECPLLLSDLPWARTVFADQAKFCSITDPAPRAGATLRSFYDAAPGLKPADRPLTWVEVARQLEAVYQSLG
jgi:glycosyltransferase involved in cell wall biosynthesis